jgi:hypothetical protein
MFQTEPKDCSTISGRAPKAPKSDELLL